MPIDTCWFCRRQLSEAASSPHFCGEDCALAYWAEPSLPPETGREGTDAVALQAARARAHGDWVAERQRFGHLADALAPALLSLCERGWSLRSIADAAHISTFLPARLIQEHIDWSQNPSVAERCEALLDCGHGYRLLDSCPTCDAGDEHAEAACDAPDADGVYQLGEGILGWTRAEADTGRWGTVLLTDTTGARVQFPAAPTGQRGTLTATVLAHRSGAYTGTLDRPATGHRTAIGEPIVLGCGELFCDADIEGAAAVALGVRPPWDEAHHLGWLDPEALHRVVGQLVRLAFTPESDQTVIRTHLPWDATERVGPCFDEEDPYGRHRRIGVLLTSLLTEQLLSDTGHAARSLWAIDRTGQAVSMVPLASAETIAAAEAEGIYAAAFLRRTEVPQAGPGAERLGLAWCMTTDQTWRTGGITALVTGRVHRLTYDHNADDIRANHDEYDRYSEAASSLVAALAASPAWRTT